ncbi:hypothetical protein BGZ88_000622, partial [Linnemannia elongata]
PHIRDKGMAPLQDSSSSSITEDRLHHTTTKDEAPLKGTPSTGNTINTNTLLHPTICNNNNHKVRHHHNFKDEEAPEVHLLLH